MPPDPQALLRSRAYVTLLVMAAVIGIPISALAWGFLALVNKLQGWIFTSLPHGLRVAESHARGGRIPRAGRASRDREYPPRPNIAKRREAGHGLW